MTEPFALILSSGYSNPEILKLVSDIVCEKGYKTAGIVTTARPEKEDTYYAKLTKTQLEEMGLKVSFVDFDKGEGIDGMDCIYVCGGNTFYLLHKAREVGFEKQVEALFERGGLYMGSSAGGILLTHDIRSAGEIHPDPNKVGMTDFKGLGYFDKNVVPHYTESLDEDIKLFEEKYNEKVVKLRDGEAIYLRDGKVEYINI